MRQITVGQNESGQRLVRLLEKYLREAPASFLYRMLRKKNIVLNDRKATGKERLAEGDVITLFLAEQTIEKFRTPGWSGATADPESLAGRIIYEDDHLLIVDKPAGLLSQRAAASDVALIDHVIQYLIQSGSLTPAMLDTFRPGLVSRLDRNTSGLVMAGKTLPALQALNDLVRDHQIRKYYTAVVEGALREPMHLTGHWSKDSTSNEVIITPEVRAGTDEVVTDVSPLAVYEREGHTFTVARILLGTGKSHQIRAHLASVGHPIAGDVKYGAGRIPGHPGQFLHASELVFPEAEAMAPCLAQVSGARFEAPLPADFISFLDKLSLITSMRDQHGER